MKKNILLIGFPGSGKTTIGKQLSKKLNLNFIDTDKILEKQFSMNLIQIVNKYQQEFQIIEKKVLNSIIYKKNSVISPGGSIIYYPDILAKFKKNSIIIHLKVPFHILEKRLGDYSKRGIIIARNQTLYDLYCERELLYNKYSDFCVNNGKFTFYKNKVKYNSEKKNIELCTKEIVKICAQL